MKKFLILLLLLLPVYILKAQAFEDKIEYDKKKQDCLAMNYAYPVEALENAFLLKMDKLGYKGKEEKGLFNKDKGFRVYNETTLSAISKAKFDYVVYFDSKSKRNDEESVLYLLILKGDENALSSLSKEDIGKAKKFMADLVPEVEEAHLELQILAQEDVVNSAEKKLNTLKEEREDLEKKIKNNQKDQEDQVKEIEDQKRLLEELKSKRKKN